MSGPRTTPGGVGAGDGEDPALTPPEVYRIELYPRPLDWRDRALCAETDPELFHPEKGGGGGNRAAKAVCAKCPVIEACLEYAMTSQAGEYGIWGGTTEHERRHLGRRVR